MQCHAMHTSYMHSLIRRMAPEASNPATTRCYYYHDSLSGLQSIWNPSGVLPVLTLCGPQTRSGMYDRTKPLMPLDGIHSLVSSHWLDWSPP